MAAGSTDRDNSEVTKSASARRCEADWQWCLCVYMACGPRKDGVYAPTPPRAPRALRRRHAAHTRGPRAPRGALPPAHYSRASASLQVDASVDVWDAQGVELEALVVGWGRSRGFDEPTGG